MERQEERHNVFEMLQKLEELYNHSKDETIVSMIHNKIQKLNKKTNEEEFECLNNNIEKIDNKYKCICCEYSTKDKSKMRNHILTKKHIFNYQMRYKLSNTFVYTNKKYTCKECEGHYKKKTNTFNNMRDMKKHLEQHYHKDDLKKIFN